MSIPGDLWGLSGDKVFTWGFVEVLMGMTDWNSLGSTYPCIKEVLGKRPRGRGAWGNGYVYEYINNKKNNIYVEEEESLQLL